MRSWRLAGALSLVWTLAMAAWLVLYQEAQVTCGPEIYRNCHIGLKITPGLGRPGIVLLWSLGLVAFALTWLTTRRARSDTVEREEQLSPAFGPPAPVAAVTGSKKPLRHRRPASLRVATTLAAFLLGVAVGGGFVASMSPRVAARAEGARVDILSATVQPAGTPSGQRRKRARVTVYLRVTNQRGSTITNLEPVLLAGVRVLPDPNATYTTGSLLEPVPPGTTATGTLRFETAGAVTDRVLATRRAQLHIAGATVPLTLDLRPPPARGKPSAASAGCAVGGARERGEIELSDPLGFTSRPTFAWC